MFRGGGKKQALLSSGQRLVASGLLERVGCGNQVIKCREEGGRAGWWESTEKSRLQFGADLAGILEKGSPSLRTGTTRCNGV
jgi:hypothetical protein